eukprot:GHVQ01023293.1.p1 GENE.GHVQ01023293.1~~GHVQ01023293.1.p1  ORF type:complete len:366 (+),score=29.30 GHVQ01023293.1:115-1212(+)
MLITRNIPNFLSSTLHRSSRLPFYVVSTSSLRCYTTRDSYIFSHCYKQTITWTSSLPHLRLFSSIPSPTPRSDESHTLVSSVECCLPKLVADSPDDSYASFLVARCSEQALLNGKLDDFAYDPSWATDAVIQVLLYCTGTFGLSWSAAIMVVGVCIRALMLPILIGVERQKRRLAAVSPQINTIKEEIQQARSQSNTKKVADAQKRFTNIQKKYGVSLMSKAQIANIGIQLPLLATFYNGLNTVATFPEKFSTYAMESPLWVDSLALPDPCTVMPFFCWGLFITNYELCKATELLLRDRARAHMTDKGSNRGKLYGRVSQRLCLCVGAQMPAPSFTDMYLPWIIRCGSLIIAFIARDWPAVGVTW